MYRHVKSWVCTLFCLDPLYIRANGELFSTNLRSNITLLLDLSTNTFPGETRNIYRLRMKHLFIYLFIYLFIFVDKYEHEKYEHEKFTYQILKLRKT